MPNIVIHRREAGGVGCAFERFEIELGNIDAIPIEALQQIPDFARNFTMTIRVLQIHELAPIELRVLPDGGLFAPSGMIRPEFFADVRKLEPGVDQNGVAMAGFDEGFEIGVPSGIGLDVVPGCDVQNADAGLTPAPGEIVYVGTNAIRGVEKGP